MDRDRSRDAQATPPHPGRPGRGPPRRGRRRARARDPRARRGTARDGPDRRHRRPPRPAARAAEAEAQAEAQAEAEAEAAAARDRQALLDDVRRQPAARPRPARHPARRAGQAAPLGARPQGVRRVPPELLRRRPLREHVQGGHVGDPGGDRPGRLAQAQRRPQAVDPGDRRRERPRQLQERHRDGARPPHRPRGLADPHQRDRRVLAGDRRRGRLLRRHGRPPLRGERAHRADPLGLRHRRADQREPVARARARLHHDVRRLDLLPAGAGRTQALEHVRQAGRVPLRELLREPVHRRPPDLHDRALRQGRRPRRRIRPDPLDAERQHARLLDARARARPDLRRRLRRRAARVPEDERPAALALVGRRANPRRARRDRRPRLLLDPRAEDVRRARLGREGGLAVPDRQVLARDRHRARVLLHAQRDPRRPARALLAARRQASGGCRRRQRGERCVARPAARQEAASAR